MDSAFEDLDAAGFLEIWQHFDADGKDIHSCLLIVLIIKIHKTVEYLELFFVIVRHLRKVTSHEVEIL